jgi:hypothetical protein
MSPQCRAFVVGVLAFTTVAGCASANREERQARNAPPLGERANEAAGADFVRNRTATVESVDARSGTVRLTHGETIRIAPSTRLHMGKDAQASIKPADVRPGDKLIIVTSVKTEPPARSRAGTAIREQASASDSSPSALPREAASLAAPGEVVEVMVFRPAR